jgi:hypothetical protein
MVGPWISRRAAAALLCAAAGSTQLACAEDPATPRPPLRADARPAMFDAADGGSSPTDAAPADDARPSDDAGAEDAGTPDQGALPDATPARCPTLSAPRRVGHIADDRLAELSGLAASRTQPDVLWAHADDEARLYAVDRTTLAVRGAYALVVDGEVAPRGDVEDLAVGDGVLYLGDIGRDHAGNTLTLWRAAEPMVPEASVDTELSAEAMHVLPGRLDDAEALWLDPTDDELYVVEKDTRPWICAAGLFQPDVTVSPDCTVRLDAPANPSGGAVSADGAWLLLRSEREAVLWYRPTGTPLLSALTGLRCAFDTLATPDDSDECNGEAITFSADGRTVYSASERGSTGGPSCPDTSVHAYDILP